MPELMGTPAEAELAEEYIIAAGESGTTWLVRSGRRLVTQTSTEILPYFDESDLITVDCFYSEHPITSEGQLLSEVGRFGG